MQSNHLVGEACWLQDLGLVIKLVLMSASSYSKMDVLHAWQVIVKINWVNLWKAISTMPVQVVNNKYLLLLLLTFSSENAE